MPATGSGEGGTTFLLDLPQATALRDGDGLVLDDSSIVRVGTASAVDPRHPTKRAAVSSTFREMAITMAGVILTETPTRWNSAHNCLPLRGRSRESSLGSELAPWERVQSE